MTKKEIEEAVVIARDYLGSSDPFKGRSGILLSQAVLALSERLERAKKVIEIVSSSLFSTEDHKDHRRLREALAETEEKP